MHRIIINFLSLLVTTITFSLNLLAADCEVTRFISNYEVSNNKLYEIDTIELQIENRSGEEYTNISIPYSKDGKVSDIDGWIEDMNGNKIRSLKRSDIHDRSEISDMSLYEDNFVKSFQLKHNSYPYKVCYTYKITANQFIAIADWSPAIYPKVSTIDAKLVVTLPKDYPYKKFAKNVLLLKSDTFENSIISVYAAKYKKVDVNEPYAEPFEDFKPKLIIVPEHFYFGIKGSAKDWKAYGNWFYNLNKGLNDLPESEKNTISQLIKGVSDKKEIIKILYHYMQDHTRYINISIGIGGLKAYPASYVSQNKYGDCKALTNYMKALLEFAGINSYFVLINRSYQPEKIIEDLPFSQFNHVLLAVPVNNDTIWIENTENSEAFNYVGSSIQNRKALFIDENNSRLISMPAMQKNDVTMLRKINITFNNQGNADAQTVFSFKGYYYESFNELNSDFNKNEQDNIVKEYMPFINYEVLDWKLNKIHRDTARIELASRLNLYKILKQLGDEFYFNTFSIKTGLFVNPSERELPLRFSYPIHNIDSVNYIIPDGMEVKSVPEDQVISTQFGNYEVHVKWDANNIYVTKKFELYPNEYSIEQYKSFYEFYKSVKEAEKKIILLKRKI